MNNPPVVVVEIIGGNLAAVYCETPISVVLIDRDNRINGDGMSKDDYEKLVIRTTHGMRDWY